MSTGVGNRKVGTLWHRVSRRRREDKKKWVRFGISTHIWVSGVARVHAAPRWREYCLLGLQCFVGLASMLPKKAGASSL